VWRVVETAEAVFQVDDYEHSVHVQTESVVACSRRPSCMTRTRKGSQRSRIGDRGVAPARQGNRGAPSKAGVEVIEARISHLAYAPEANAMLRRQQATRSGRGGSDRRRRRRHA
jgi:hypothetical protein